MFRRLMQTRLGSAALEYALLLCGVAVAFMSLYGPASRLGQSLAATFYLIAANL